MDHNILWAFSIISDMSVLTMTIQNKDFKDIKLKVNLSTKVDIESNVINLDKAIFIPPQKHLFVSWHLLGETQAVSYTQLYMTRGRCRWYKKSVLSYDVIICFRGYVIFYF